MRTYVASSAMAICLVLALITGCSDKSSLEACQYQTTMNLDTGNYDAVLASSCATPMHMAAAYFGKAGYSVTSVLNTLISAQTTSATSDKALRQYMNVLTGKVTPQTLAFLDDSQAKYLSILPSSELYKAAQFDLSIVLAVKSMSLLKSAIDSTGLGTLSSCDVNANGVPDEADATTCALLAGGSANPITGSVPVSGATATWTATGDLFFSGMTGTYRGLTVSVGSQAGACAGNYQKLLYQNPSDGNYYAATTAGSCTTTQSSTWPCPVTSQIDLVNSVGISIDGTETALSTALSGTTSSEVTTAIDDIKIQACGGLTSTCTATTIAEYLQTGL